jgi:hypothetical protein
MIVIRASRDARGGNAGEGVSQVVGHVPRNEPWALGFPKIGLWGRVPGCACRQQRRGRKDLSACNVTLAKCRHELPGPGLVMKRGQGMGRG